MIKSVDNCKCGALKYTHESVCFVCKDTPPQFSRVSLPTVQTTHYCEKHEKFYSTGNHCKECLDGLAEQFAELGKKEEEITGISSPTGSLRFNTGKSQTNEIDPSFLLGMGRVLEKSRKKYPRANWARGNNYSVPWDSMMRHLLAWQQGESIDKESGENHLYHAALNLMMLAFYEENFPEFDDRIFKKEKK